MPLAPPVLNAGWRGSAAQNSSWQPVQHGADQERHWRMARADEAVELYAAGYIEQRQRKKLGGRANVPGGIDSDVLDEGHRQVGDKIFATQLLIHAGSKSSLWRIYQIDDRWFASATRAQLWYSARTFVTLRSPASRVWMLRTECANDCIAADLRLARFVEENGEVLWPDSR
jgi:EpsI family protein